jgi:hypothetical protein
MLLTIGTDEIIAIAAVCQVLITGVGFILLYTTFVLQAKVASDQQKMLEIENRRARREVRPIFKVTGTYDITRIPGWNTFDFTCDLNDAYNLQIRTNSGVQVIIREPETNIPFVKKGSSLIYSYRFRDGLPTYVDLSLPSYHIEMTLTFEDVDGFRYKQVISGEHCQLDPQRPVPI